MAGDERDAAALGDSLAGGALRYTNAGGGPFRYAPGELTLTLAADGLRRFPAAEVVEVIPPPGWRAADGARRAVGDGALAWRLAPGGIPATCEQGIALAVLGAGGRRLGTLRHAVPVELYGASQFDPERHTLPFRNSSGDFGPVEPRLDLFLRTYRRGGTVLPAAFFAGLYRDIVFLSAATAARGSGGLCTGMARFALERSLLPDEAARPLAGRRRAVAMEAVQAWHGRQLTDRALLAAARQVLAPSPTAAFRRFRDQVLASGRGAVAFDIGIARWEPSPARWGAIFQRLVTQGHTITPYAFRQTSDRAAEVLAYDPSYPDRADWPENVVRFDLIDDRYAYRGFGTLDRDDPTTVLAVPQEHFAGQGTAYLASLANLALHPELLAAEWRDNGTLRRNAALAVGLLAAALALRARPRA